MKKVGRNSPKKNLMGGVADGDWLRFLVFEHGMPLLSSNPWLGRVAPFCDLVGQIDGDPLLQEAVLICLHLLGEPKSPLRMLEDLDARNIVVEMSKLVRISTEWCRFIITRNNDEFENSLLMYKSLGQHKRVTGMAKKVVLFYESTLETLLASENYEEMKELVNKGTLDKALAGLSNVTNIYLSQPKRNDDETIENENSNKSIWEELLRENGYI